MCTNDKTNRVFLRQNTLPAGVPAVAEKTSVVEGGAETDSRFSGVFL